jgi:Xaa-Pro aminopeptidase
MVRKDPDRARMESPLKEVVPISRMSQIGEELARRGVSISRLGLELDVLPAAVYLRLAGMFDGVEIVDVSDDIRRVRAVKSDFEIERMRQAAAFSDRLAERLPALIKEGMPEIELAGLIEAEARRLGHQGIVRMRMFGGELFYGHLMAGAAGAVKSFLSSPTGGPGMHPSIAQGSSFRPIRKNEPILFDYAFVYGGYISDHTRIFVLGELPPALVEGHAAMLSVQERLREAGKPGARTGDLYALALEEAVSLGVDQWFMGHGGNRIRFVGHGVGLELDEYPFLAHGQTLPLEAGMTVALEPKLVIPEKGVVGVENTHLVTETGMVPLSAATDEIRPV